AAFGLDVSTRRSPLTCIDFLSTCPATTEIYTLSLHDALPIFRFGNVIGSRGSVIPLFLEQLGQGRITVTDPRMSRFMMTVEQARSEEHTSELQSREKLVCRLLLEKKKDIEEFGYENL